MRRSRRVSRTTATVAAGLFAFAIGLLYARASADPHGPGERGLRAGLAGVNAAANHALLSAVGLRALAAPSAILGLAAASEEVSREPRFKRALGWANWLLPMSWPVTFVGLLVFVVDMLAHLVAGERWEAARVSGVELDAGSGTVVTEGGLLAKPGFVGGFNFGSFSFLTPGGRSVAEHEAGHALNLAAFGWVFHLIGGVERKVRRDPMEAYAERLAEGNRSDSRRADRVLHWRGPAG